MEASAPSQLPTIPSTAGMASENAFRTLYRAWTEAVQQRHAEHAALLQDALQALAPRLSYNDKLPSELSARHIAGRLGRHRHVAAQACRSFRAMVGAAKAWTSLCPHRRVSYDEQGSAILTALLEQARTQP